MKRTVTLLLIILTCLQSVKSLNNNIDSELHELESVLVSRPAIEAQKRVRIDSLNHLAAVTNGAYEIYRDLYEEYRSYNYDTALIFVKFMEREATAEQMPEVQLCRAFVYLSGGLFKEAFDILDKWHSTDSTLLIDYYITRTRLMWDLADHAGGEIGEAYNAEGLRLNRQLYTYLSPTDTARYWYCLAVHDLREGNYQRSIERCLLSLSATQPSVHYRAMTASTLAYIYRLTGNNEAALHYNIDAAICDIRSSTYETVAMRNIAELLFEAGKTMEADRYIHLAMQDAQRYHARHRQVSIAQSLPIIEQQMLSRIQWQQQLAWGLLTIVALLLVAGIVGIIVLSRKNKAVHNARHTIDRMNRSLMEANKLKEQMLSTLLVGQSQYLNAVAQYQQDVRQNAANRRWSELMSIPKRADARLQRTQLDRQWDTMLLNLYPTFVEDINALLRPAEPIVLKKDELLNAQLRIFALIRLGITQNEVIAEILDYSINTVYSYKTRIIAQSDLSPEAFYTALMQIPSFSKQT